jgi:hypothetical protein
MIDGKYYLVNNFIKIIINDNVALQLKKTKNQKDLVQTSLFTTILSHIINYESLFFFNKKKKPHHQCSHNKILSTTYNLPPKIDSWHREDLNNVMSPLKNTKNCQLSYKAFGNQLELLYFHTSRKPVRCTRKLLKIKSKLILILFTSFVEYVFFFFFFSFFVVQNVVGKIDKETLRIGFRIDPTFWF